MYEFVYVLDMCIYMEMYREQKFLYCPSLLSIRLFVFSSEWILESIYSYFRLITVDGGSLSELRPEVNADPSSVRPDRNFWIVFEDLPGTSITFLDSVSTSFFPFVC